MWAVDEVAEAVHHASPVLAGRVTDVLNAEHAGTREAYRAAVSVARYVQRMMGRPAPFGLMSGVATASFGSVARVCWGNDKRVVAGAAAPWLATVIGRLEACPAVLARLPVVANSVMNVRGDRLVVPYRSDVRAGRGMVAVEASLRHTAAVRIAVDASRAPICVEDLAAKVRAELPDAAPVAVDRLLAQLVATGALITSLRAPATRPDALGHLVEQLTADVGSTVDAVAGLVRDLTEVRELLQRYNESTEGRAQREAVASQMRRVADVPEHPLALDVLLDAEMTLPDEVALEVERAALVLTRLSAHPYGNPAWRTYHQRFYERFGIGSMVPLADVVDPDSGIGFPDGYPGAPPQQRRQLTRRDDMLLGLAQQAALDSHDEIVVDDALLAALEAERRNGLRPPPHLELAVRVIAADLKALQRKDFGLEVVSVSRGAGVLSGRFLSVLPDEVRARLCAALADLPVNDPETIRAQVSFPPLDPGTWHVARTVAVLPTAISLAEHRGPDPSVLTMQDLAVACDGRRMYLAAPRLGLRVEPVAMHALNLNTHTPPLARFLIELGRAQCAQVTTFDWGAASALPFLPRIRFGRTILSPATWRIGTCDLPDRTAPWPAWQDTLIDLLARRRVPHRVYLIEADQRLPLDLRQLGHRELLHAHLARHADAVLAEAPGPEDQGWCDGRPHELIVPLHATTPPAWPKVPIPTPARLISRDHGQTPAASTLLLAKLYGHIDRKDTLLAEHLPELLATWQTPLDWWFLRFRDPDPHLRLRIRLADPNEFGPAARRVSTWADRLHQRGLMREVQYATSYPETGRWGDGPAMRAAETVFAADSRALLVQLGLRQRPHREALVAAHSAAIAVAFTGSVDAGMRWLIDHVPAAAPQHVPRSVFTEAVRLADPRDGFAAMRTAPGGDATVAAWPPRDQALAAYRAHLPGPHTQGIDIDDVLGSLLHAHFIRAVGIDFDDEAVCLYLARAGALAYFARTTGGRR